MNKKSLDRYPLNFKRENKIIDCLNKAGFDISKDYTNKALMVFIKALRLLPTYFSPLEIARIMKVSKGKIKKIDVKLAIRNRR